MYSLLSSSLTSYSGSKLLSAFDEKSFELPRLRFELGFDSGVSGTMQGQYACSKPHRDVSPTYIVDAMVIPWHQRSTTLALHDESEDNWFLPCHRDSCKGSRCSSRPTTALNSVNYTCLWFIFARAMSSLPSLRRSIAQYSTVRGGSPETTKPIANSTFPNWGFCMVVGMSQ
jgi:hypothetical protein